MKKAHDDSCCDCPLVRRLPIKFSADDRWVVTRPFFPGGEARIRNVMDRVCQLPEEQVAKLLTHVQSDFYSRHQDMESVLREHYGQASDVVSNHRQISDPKQLLIGAYFTMEYAFASAALFNPSIVAHPDQSDLDSDSLRFIMSLRATGEGHVSSIVPNVVYTCGAIVHTSCLFIPNAMSDTATGFAMVPLDQLLNRLLGC